MSEMNLARNLYDGTNNIVKTKDDLIIWDHKIVYRPYNDFTIGRISRKIEQGVESELSIDEAIDVLLENPFAGEKYAGDLIDLVVNTIQGSDLNRNDNRKNLLIVTELSDDNIDDFKWASYQDKERFDDNILRLKRLFRKR